MLVLTQILTKYECPSDASFNEETKQGSGSESSRKGKQGTSQGRSSSVLLTLFSAYPSATTPVYRLFHRFIVKRHSLQRSCPEWN
eukprot:719752-Amphidinium_carterae.1